MNISGLWTRFNADNINANFLAWPSRSAFVGGSAILSDITVVGDTIVAGRVTGVGVEQSRSL